MEWEDRRDGDGGEELEASMLRADRPFGAGLFGTTAEEALEGPPLDRLLARERPEEPAVEEALVVVDEGLSDVEAELVGDGVLERDPFVAPEEAALSARDAAPGATDHPDPHPLDEV
jgi:hypothetical protein